MGGEFHVGRSDGRSGLGLLRRNRRDAKRLLMAGSMRAARVDGACLRLGEIAHWKALKAAGPEPPVRRVLSDRLEAPARAEDWLQRGGCGLVVEFTRWWPSRGPKEHGALMIDWHRHAAEPTDLRPIPLTAGIHALQVPTARGVRGRTAGMIEIAPGVIASVVYRYRFPDGCFLPKTLRTLDVGNRDTQARIFGSGPEE